MGARGGLDQKTGEGQDTGTRGGFAKGQCNGQETDARGGVGQKKAKTSKGVCAVVSRRARARARRRAREAV